MIVKPQLSHGWRIGALLLFGCVTLAAGWWLKPVEIRSGSGGKIPVRDESNRHTSNAGNPQKANTPAAPGMEQYLSSEIRAKVLTKGGWRTPLPR